MPLQLLSKPNGVIKQETANVYRGKPVVETLTNGYFIVDQDWTVTYWNKQAEKLLGVKESDIIGKNLWDKFANSIPIEFYSVYYKAFLQDIPIHFQEYWAEMNAWFDVLTWHSDNKLYVSFKSNNSPLHVSADSAQEHLKTLTELYKFVTEITNDCLWEWDLRSNEIFWIDGGHKRVFGYQIENTLIPDSFWKSCIHPDDRDHVLKKLNELVKHANQDIWEDEYRFRKSDGGYIYVHDRGRVIYEDGQPARIIGATQDINNRILLEKELAEQKADQQRKVTAAVLTALENERQTIGRELHDNLGQILAVAKMYLQMGKKFPGKREATIDKALGLVVSVMSEIRKISKSLVIPSNNIIGLFDNIKILIRDVMEINPVKIKFDKIGIVENDISEDLQISIFRILQEQLSNILKHSKATHASIRLTKENDQIKLLIQDDGQGHNMWKEKKGIGLMNIRSRADVHRGSVNIVTKRGKGYQLNVVFPSREMHAHGLR